MFNKSNNKWTKWHHIFHKAIIKNQDFIPDGSHLLVSVSGGQDSMALLTLLDDIKKLHDWTINVWHGNHMWHSNSQKFANELSNYCLKKNIIFYLDEVNKVDVSTEEKARKWRYEKLSEKSSEILIKNNTANNIYIITGHTSTDNTETFLLNLARGSNFKGLAGIPKKRLLNNKYFLMRPFLIFTRNDTTAICEDLKIPFWEDPTNSDTNLKRNLIRHRVIKDLEEIYPGCSLRINNLIQKIRNLNEERSELCELAAASCICSEGIKRSILNKLGEQSRSTILHYILSKECLKQITSQSIDELSEQILRKSNGQKDFPNGITIIWNKNFIKIMN